MERLRRILFLTASIGSAAQAQSSAAPTPSQGYKDFQARRDAAINVIRQTNLRLNAKAMDPETLLAEIKRRIGASSQLAQRLAKNPELEKHFLEVLANAKDNGWGDILSLIEGDEVLKAQLQDLLKDGSFTSQLQDAVDRVFGQAFGADNRDKGAPGGSGGLSGGGGGGGSSAGAGKSKSADPASSSSAPLNAPFKDEVGQAEQNGISVDPSGAPTQIQGDGQQQVAGDTPNTNLGQRLADGLGGGDNSTPARSREPLASSGAGLSGGNGGNAASDMGDNQGNQQNQQAANNQPAANSGTPTSGPHADTSGAGTGGLKGRNLVSGKTPTGGSPLQSATKPQAAASTPKKAIDPAVALIQTPYLEGLLKKYQNEPQTYSKEIDSIKALLEQNKKAIYAKYPDMQKAPINSSAICDKLYEELSKAPDKDKGDQWLMDKVNQAGQAMSEPFDRLIASKSKNADSLSKDLMDLQKKSKVYRDFYQNISPKFISTAVSQMAKNDPAGSFLVGSIIKDTVASLVTDPLQCPQLKDRAAKLFLKMQNKAASCYSAAPQPHLLPFLLASYSQTTGLSGTGINQSGWKATAFNQWKTIKGNKQALSQFSAKTAKLPNNRSIEAKRDCSTHAILLLSNLARADALDVQEGTQNPHETVKDNSIH